MRVQLSVPVAQIHSFTDKTMRYTLTMHGYVTCSCLSAANPLPGRRYGQCKHTDKFESDAMLRTHERDQLVKSIQEGKARLRAFDGGDAGNPMSMPDGWRLPEIREIGP